MQRRIQIMLLMLATPLAFSQTAGLNRDSFSGQPLAALGSAAPQSNGFTGKGSPWFDVIAYGATGNAKAGGPVVWGALKPDGVTGAGSPVFTAASAPFNCSNDIGKVIQIESAGSGGMPLLTTISGCASSSSITLATPAVSAARNQLYFFGTDDSAAFIAARNAAAAVGGKVFVPTGTYLLSARSVVTNGHEVVSFEGTCSTKGKQALATGGVPAPTCSTIIDGSNLNGTFQFIGSQSDSIRGLYFLSFPKSLERSYFLRKVPAPKSGTIPLRIMLSGESNMPFTASACLKTCLF